MLEGHKRGRHVNMKMAIHRANSGHGSNNKQPMGCDAQLAVTQIGRGNVRERRANFGDKLSGKCLSGMFKRNVLIPVQDYRSLHGAVMLCVTLVNGQTHTQTGTQTAFDRLY